MAMAIRQPIDFADGTFGIPLTHGKVAVIDSCDLPLVADRNWFAHLRNKKPSWYAVAVFDGKQKMLHRHLMGLVQGDPRQVDHIDGDQGNNRRCNLRIVSNTENNRNRRTAIGRIGFKGVTVQKKRFRAKITVSGKGIFLGTFPDPVSAALAYDAAAEQHFGEFAATNASLGLLTPQEAAQ